MAVQRIDSAEQFDIEYPRCREWLLEALTYSENNISERDLLNGLIERDYLLWTSDNAACVTSLTEWREEPVCVLFLVGGEKGKAMQCVKSSLRDRQSLSSTHENARVKDFSVLVESNGQEC